MNTPYVDELRSGKLLAQEENNNHNKLLYKTIQKDILYLTKNGIQNDDVTISKNDPDRALYAYPLKHYNYWDEHLIENQIDLGALGENLVLSGVNEFTTFIGDTFKFGEAIIQVSQPLQPKLLPHYPFSSKEFISQMKQTGKTGWFYRVIEEGEVKGDVELELIDRPYPQWSIAAINEVMYIDKHNLRAAYELGNCELLSSNWKKVFKRRLQSLP